MDLFDYLRRYGEVDEKGAFTILRQVCDTVMALKACGIFHGDIKDENLLVNTKTLAIELIDFGLAVDFDSSKLYEDCRGTLEYFSPEKYDNDPYGAEAETVWSLGLLLLRMVEGFVPSSMCKDLRNIGFCQIAKQRSLAMSASCQELLCGMLEVNPAKRLTVEDFLRSKWMASEGNKASDMCKLI